MKTPVRLGLFAAIALTIATALAAPESDNEVTARKNALDLAGAFTNEGFKMRDGHWSGTIKPKEHALIAVNLYAGNQYWFSRIALSLEGVEEYPHAGLPAFRVTGRKFASLASQAEGYGNLMLTLEQQAAFVEEAPDIFLPIPGGWGKMGHTHIRLAAASKDVLTGALRTAWKLRIDKSAKTTRKNRHVPSHHYESNKSAKHEEQ